MSSQHYHYRLPNYLKKEFDKSFGQRSSSHLHKNKPKIKPLQQRQIIKYRQSRQLTSNIFVNEEIQQFEKNLILVQKKAFSGLSRQQSIILSQTKGYIEISKAKRQKSLQSGQASRLTQKSKTQIQKQQKKIQQKQ